MAAVTENNTQQPMSSVSDTKDVKKPVIEKTSSESSSVKIDLEKAAAHLVNGNGTATNGVVKINGGVAREKDSVKSENVGVKKRRKRSDSLVDDDSHFQPSLGKRVRLQHQPFQSPAVKNVVPSFFRPPPSSSKNGDNSEEKIVVFNKGDFLAVRNELNGFYVCRTAQNVYKDSRKFKIQWLNDEKDYYKPDFFDKTDFECVLTNLRIVRLGKGRYKLPEDERKRATNILQRALNVEKGVTEIPDPKQVIADGVDVSIIGKMEEKELVDIVSMIEQKREKSTDVVKDEKKELKISPGKASRRASVDISSKSSRASSRRPSSEIEKPVLKSEVEKLRLEPEKVKESDSKPEVKVVGKRGRKKKHHSPKKQRTLRSHGPDPLVIPTSPLPVVKKNVPKKVTTPPAKPSKVVPVKPATTKTKPRSEKLIREKRQAPTAVKAVVTPEKKVVEVVKKPTKKIPSPIQSKTPTSPKKDNRPSIDSDYVADLIGVVSTNWFKDMDKPAPGIHGSILTAIHGSVSHLRSLITDGADVNMKEAASGNTALHMLCKISKKPEKILETLKEILNHSPDVNSVNNDGRSPLHFATNSVMNEIDLTVVEILLSFGAARRIKDKFGRIPLHYAFVKIDREDDTTFSDPIELTIMLTNGDADSVNEKDSKGQLPIHRAAQRGATFCVTHLIRCSDKFIDERDCDSNTPLAIAVRSGYENCTFSMILKKCNFGLSITRSPPLQTTSNRWSWIHAVNEPKVPEETSIMIEIMRRKWNRLIHFLLEMLPQVGKDLSHALIAAIKCHNIKLALKIVKRMGPNMTGPFLHSLTEIIPNEDNKEQVCKVFHLILEKSLSKFDTMDSNNSSPLIAAAVNHNLFFCDEITKRMDSVESILTLPDGFGRNPMTSLFYRFTTNDIDPKIQSWAGKLAAGKSSLFDVPCFFPVKESIYPSVRYVHDDSLFASRFPPLIFSVIKGNFHEVKFLMSQKVDLNVTDDRGRSALMHAVRLNDIKMVKALLTTRYDPETDHNPWSSGYYSFQKSTPVDLSLVDNEGNTVVHHAVCPLTSFSYLKGDVVIRLLANAGAPLNIANASGKTPLQLAQERKAEKLARALVEKLKDVIPADKHPKVVDASATVSNGTGICGERDIPNYESDYSAVIDSLNVEESCQLLKVAADKLLGFGDSSEVLMDEKQNVPYSVLLIKPDKDNWGISHFYKLQVAIHKQRSIVVLFNHSGQLGQLGVHSKETYPQKKDAIEEFVKQFKLKTGNNWLELDKFVNQPKKYRLIPMKIRSTDIKARLDSLKSGKEPIKSILSTDVSKLMTHVMNDLMTPPSSEDVDCVNCVKLITENAIKKAEDILFEIGVIIGEREKELKQVSTKKGVSINASKVHDQLIELSDEFYDLIPMPIKSRLNPILNESDHRLKNDILRRIRNHIVSGKIIIGSYNKLSSVNQLDYIYDCLKCQINILDPVSVESQILLQYVHNSSLNQKNKPKVEGIYKINKKSQVDQLVKANLSNHWLLFHSVPLKELINILSTGLQLTSSDTFMKGISFSDSICAITNSTVDSKFILICEVALGNVEETSNALITQPSSGGYNSVKRASVRWQPDPVQSVYWDGRVIPVGPLIEDTSSEVTHLFNEFVVFDPSQVCIRYLIQISPLQ